VHAVRGADSPGAVYLGVASPSAVGGAQMVSALPRVRRNAWPSMARFGCYLFPSPSHATFAVRLVTWETMK
jgi:hypothetical protein